jgi:hypothetical protein
MAGTPLAATVRFIEVSVAQYYWVPAIANTGAPSAAEINAGTILTGQIPQDGVAGFATTSDTVDAGDFASRFVSKISGLINAEDSSLTFYRSSTSSDVRSLLTRDLTGFIIIAGEGMVTGKKMDVFAVTVTSAPKVHAGTDPAKITVSFVITKVPDVDVTIPAGV